MATPHFNDGLVETVSFRNVPSFVSELDARVTVPDLGEITYDLAFGGAFYAYVAGVALDDTSGLIRAGIAIKQAIEASRDISHPDDPDLGFLYGVIFTGQPEDPDNHSLNVCVFADGEVDRSPTGTGVSGRMAILYARGELDVHQPIRIESIVGSVFGGRIVETTMVGSTAAVIPEVSGTPHILGRSEFWLDPNDDLDHGFLLR